AVDEAQSFLRVHQLATRSGGVLDAREAAEQFAIEAPDLSLARAAASIQAFNTLGFLRMEERTEVLKFARSEAKKAISLDPNEGSGYLASAFVIPADKWNERLAMIRKGLTRDPYNPSLHGFEARLLLATGAADEALAPARAAMAGEPLGYAKTI